MKMNIPIRNQLESHISQLKQILSNLNAYKKNYTSLQKSQTDTTVDLIGMAVGEIFGSRKVVSIGKKLLKAKIKSEKNQQLEQIQSYQISNFENILYQVRNFLETISIEKKNLSNFGNSNLLLKKLASIESYSKFETKVKRMITILSQIKEEQLIYNKDIEQLKKQKKEKKKLTQPYAYEIIKKLEENLRQIIKSELSKISSDWWKQRVPEDVRKNADIKKIKNESPWSWLKSGTHIIDYIDFTDYYKIISRRDNWNNIFKNIFYDKEKLIFKLKELEPIRNAIMHSRNLSSKQLNRLQLYAEDIIEMIQNFHKK